MTTTVPLTLYDVERARELIHGHVRRTPLERSAPLSERLHSDVHLKLECFQVTGSFKPRGSFCKLLSLPEEVRRRGVIASTAGNHGVGLSYAAQRLHVPADIYLPRWADGSKLRMLEQNGARLTFFESVEEARERAKADAVERQLTFVSAYNDREMIAGGGTVALEIIDDLAEVEEVVICVGGGGLAAGMAVALKARNPAVRICGVQAANSPKMSRWLAARAKVDVPLRPSIAEGLAVNMEDDTITFPLLLETMDEIVEVSEDEIREALVWLFEHHQLAVEPSGAVTVAALLKLGARGARKIAAVISGRNVALDRYRQLLAPVA